MDVETATIADLVMNRTLFGVPFGEIGRYGLLVIMLTMGLSLRPANFMRLFTTPVLGGLAGQMLLLSRSRNVELLQLPCAWRYRPVSNANGNQRSACTHFITGNRQFRFCHLH